MATTTLKPESMNSITGKITLKESGIEKSGIPDLVVSFYAVKEKYILPSNVKLDTLLKNSSRMGSTSTDASGSFLFEHGDSESTESSINRKRFDVFIVVSTPDNDKENAGSQVIFFSNPPRYNVGKKEHFNITISKKALIKFGLLDDDSDEARSKSIKEKIETYEKEKIFKKEYQTGIAEVNKKEIEIKIEEKKKFREEFKKKIATDFDSIKDLSGIVVKDNEKIEDATVIIAERTIDEVDTVINGSNSKGVPFTLYLSPAERERYFGTATSGKVEIPEQDVREILFRTSNTDNPGTLLLHENPIEKFCMEQSVKLKCALNHTGLVSDPNHESVPTDAIATDTEPATAVTSITNEDIPKYIANLIDSMPSPDSVLTPEFNNQRASKGEIEKSVEDFSLNKGPAETPAFYDFHSLQIAFKHVWKQLLDEDIIEAAHKVNEEHKAKFGMEMPDLVVAMSPEFADSATENQDTAPGMVKRFFDITDKEWNKLDPVLQAALSNIADTTERYFVLNWLGTTIGKYESLLKELKNQAERIIDTVRVEKSTIRDLKNMLKGKYEFTVFAADKDFHFVNFGILNTFRQKWVPLNYQAGKLVKTMALSPKEERKYSLKVTQSIKHITKEAIKNNTSFTSEQSSTSRVETDIISKAQNKTNFSLSATGDYNVGISKGSSTSNFGTEAASDSSNDRKDFRESVLKATQEYKEERSVEVTTEEDSTYEYNESGTIVNPNDELAVTYLFYELQRRYRISEQLYRVMPVVLVAQEVPSPHHITEAWVISNDWIINRVLLDDSFRTCLKYLATKSVGDQFEIEELRKNLQQQRDLVNELRREFARASSEAENKYEALLRRISTQNDIQHNSDNEGIITTIGGWFGANTANPEVAQAREDAAKDEHQYAIEKANKVSESLKQEINSLNTITNAYNKARRTHLDNEAQIKRLLVHIRNNILYYMQAIWSMEPPDQRFFRLHKVKVANLQADGERTYTVEVAPDPAGDIFAQFREEGTTRHRGRIKGKLKKPVKFKPLVEVADLDTMLGFKGNYMIFPLKKHNALTEFMAAPYIDSAFGAMDPDQLSNINLEEYSKYICCLHDHLTPEKFDELKPDLVKWLQQLLANPLRNGDEIIVPTGSLFIECLPGTKPLLENFKLRHRELDVYKVQAEVRKMELENIRYAARLLSDEREDPDVDKKILVEGNGMNVNLDVDN